MKTANCRETVGRASSLHTLTEVSGLFLPHCVPSDAKRSITFCKSVIQTSQGGLLLQCRCKGVDVEATREKGCCICASLFYTWKSNNGLFLLLSLSITTRKGQSSLTNGCTEVQKKKHHLGQPLQKQKTRCQSLPDSFTHVADIAERSPHPYTLSHAQIWDSSTHNPIHKCHCPPAEASV